MPSLAELLAQQRELVASIESQRETEFQESLVRIREIMETVGMSDAELISHMSKRRHNAGGKVAPKYRNPVNGETWTGRGRKPIWVEQALAAGQQLSDLAIPTMQ